MNLIFPKEIVLRIDCPRDQLDVVDLLDDWKVKFCFSDGYDLIIEVQDASHLSYARTEDFLDVLEQCGVRFVLRRVGYRVYEVESDGDLS